MVHHSSAVPNSAEQAIAARIGAAMPTLTPIHRRMGEYVLANLFRAATMRIDELASVVGASVASANRFARALGFDGYPQFRDALVRGFEATLAPVERLRSAQESLAAGDDLIDASLEQAANNLHATRTSIDRAAADAAVEAIISARRVFVLGFGASAFLASLMEHGLLPYHDNVRSLALIGGPSHAARQLVRSNEGDLVIGIAFPRYVEDTIELARRASERGARVLALTDSPASPLAQFADLALYIRTDRRLASNADSAVLAVIEALCDAVAYRAQRSVKAAAEVSEFVLPWLFDPQTGAAGTKADATHIAKRGTKANAKANAKASTKASTKANAKTGAPTRAGAPRGTRTTRTTRTPHSK
ncbi:MurR/RpiR family transcriptional regulator [Paraburkholderia sp. MMS20-SJTR3]|uniref:MurR/RpiR family transcriptional regulator n=1 Tax=Paraburkholderia sejongensis TaxID=2886946 RepID=A0ABS8JWE0_9BURK|nr:MurR/RpiR family transcriptional regulator [Paraburkholderia sp. MMS20-SJTR3]MCC8394217.1 MurR/RpiR family transcriptional regulator [Paraburkholderia sp. MMS20-SJTR3]